MENNIPKMSMLKWLFMVLLILVALGFVVLQIINGWSGLKSQTWSFSPFELVISILLLLSNFLLTVYAWLVIFHDLGEKISFRQCFAILFTAQIGRYIPGKVWLVLGQLYMAEQMGFRKSSALTASILQNVAGMLAGLLMIAITALVSGFDIWLVWLSLCISAAGLIIFILAPAQLEIWINKWRVRRKQQPVKLTISKAALIKIVMVMLTGWAVLCAAFISLVSSLTTIDPDGVLQLAFAYIFAYYIGLLILIVPGGIGVREGALSYFLVSHFGPAMAGIIALIQRLWYVFVELLCFMLAAAMARKEMKALLRLKKHV